MLIYPTFRYILFIATIIIALILAILLFRQHQLHKTATQHIEIYQDSLAYLNLLVQASERLLKRDPDGAIEWFNRADANRPDNPEWHSKVVNFIDVQQSLMLYNDSLRQNQFRLQQIISRNRQQLNLLQRQVSQKNGQVDSLNQQLVETFANIDLIAHTNQQLLEKITELGERLGDYQEHITALETAHQSLVFEKLGRTVRFFGKTENGKANGFGIGIFDSKGIYEGEWRDNVRHGKGRYVWANNDTYEGDFQNGNRHGYGVYTFASGEQYRGEWRDDLRHGEGAMHAKDGKKLLEGIWINDKFDRQKTKQEQAKN